MNILIRNVFNPQHSSWQRRMILSIVILVLSIGQTEVWAQQSEILAEAQQTTLQGYVRDAETGETLLLATVSIKGTTKGVTTNGSGYYSLTTDLTGVQILQARFIGYNTVEQEIDLDSEPTIRLDFDLPPENLTLEEIVVESERDKEALKNIGVAQVKTEQIKKLPAVFEPDVFRSVQLLPGVKAASDYSSGLYIRGGGPDQTLILLDETTVYNPSHFFGFFSTFNPDAVKDIRLFKGGYPAEYGGRLGSVLSVYNKDGNRNQRAGGLSIGLLASRAYIEGPVGDGSYMFAVRRSTLEPLLAALRQSIDAIPTTFYFYDINGKVTQSVSENDQLSVAFYSGTDVVALPFADDADIRLNYGNRTLSSSWKRILPKNWFTTLTFTGSTYQNKPQFTIAGTPFSQRNEISDVSIKFDAEHQPSPTHDLKMGLWAGNMILKLRNRFDGEETFRNRIQANYASVYFQDEWRPNDRWVARAGIRVNAFSEGNYIEPEPRVSLEFRPNASIRLQAAYGRYSQFLTLISNEAFSGFDTWLTVDNGVPPAYGDQWILGIKTEPFQGYGFDVEFYARTMNNLFELDPFLPDAAGLDYEELFRFGEGYAYGVEVFLERQVGRFTGFIGYTYGVTRRKFPGFNAAIGSNTPRFYPPKYDRTHDANIVATYRLSDRWTANAVFSYGTGQAYTEPLGRTQFPSQPWSNEENDVLLVGKVNASRLPANHRLDLSFSRQGRFFDLADSEFQIQVINAYSRRNVWFYQYDFDKNPVKQTTVPLLPILPAFSYTLTF